MVCQWTEVSLHLSPVVLIEVVGVPLTADPHQPVTRLVRVRVTDTLEEGGLCAGYGDFVIGLEAGRSQLPKPPRTVAAVSVWLLTVEVDIVHIGTVEAEKMIMVKL